MAKIRFICFVFLALICAARLHAEANPIVQVEFTDLMAGQFNVGYHDVSAYTVPPVQLLYTTGWYNGQTDDPNNWYGPGPEGLWAYQREHPAPVIWGPFSNGANPIYHLLDNHHRTTAFYRLSTIYTISQTVTVTNPLGEVYTTNIGPAPSSVYVEQTLNWSTTSTSQFWADMQMGNTGGVTNFAPVEGGLLAASTNQPTYVWNYDLGQAVDLNLTTPPFIPGLTDDTLRSVAGDISFPQDNAFGTAETGYLRREAVGEVLYYQEFYWANYLRSLVYWDTAGTSDVSSGMDPSAPNVFTNYDQLTLFAANLAWDPAASDLPGYIVPEPTTTVFLLLGMAVIVFCVRARQTKTAE